MGIETPVFEAPRGVAALALFVETGLPMVKGGERRRGILIRVTLQTAPGGAHEAPGQTIAMALLTGDHCVSPRERKGGGLVSGGIKPTGPRANPIRGPLPTSRPRAGVLLMATFTASAQVSPVRV